jgi:phage gp36-like protein
MYITLDDIKKSLPEEAIIQLTDDEDMGGINEARVDEAIAQADSVIDSYCGSLYAVPFSAPPKIIKNISADIAIYNLYSRKVDAVPEARLERYRDAIKQLEGISKGVITLGSALLAPSESQANTSPEDRVFTRDTLGNY